MNTKTSNSIFFGLILVSAAASIAFYPSLPQTMTSHWGIAGEPNGFMPKFWAAFFAPVLMVLFMGLFWILPKIDPLRHNISSFRNQYNVIVVSIVGFLAVVHGYVLAWNLGLHIPVGRVIIPLLALLFFTIGSELPQTKQNWFLGIRTPWTMSSETVWRKTHEHAKKVFQWLSLAMLLGLLIPRFAFAIVIVGTLATTCWIVLYSYLVYTKSQKHT